MDCRSIDNLIFEVFRNDSNMGCKKNEKDPIRNSYDFWILRDLLIVKCLLEIDQYQSWNSYLRILSKDWA